MRESLTEIRIDRSRCVICGEANDCAMARSGSVGSVGNVGNVGDDEGRAKDSSPCWCVDETFPGSLLERARTRDEAASCICRRCLERERAKATPGD